ncbi:DUF305 domain-containing protein [Leifsonia sp. AG29]|uniref:DUF305 domain-containing protein n=1 Tax=Leifsonia sp. AG29 TaxID=2598860 RepID=UPI00131CC6BA|nr:DUF305 domain-containing protein [Leifsonia sp. AG29]
MDGMTSQADMDALHSATGDGASALFLLQMIQHHSGTVAMATTEIEKGRSPDEVALACSLVAARTAEVAVMRGLLADL